MELDVRGESCQIDIGPQLPPMLSHPGNRSRHKRSSNAMNDRFQKPARLLIVALMMISGECLGDDELLQKGSAIYQNLCAKCHGNSGEGVEERYKKPLAGDATIKELAKLITDTMPEDDPEACVGQDALAVATYIHQTFYGKSARQPQIRLARLTGTQLRQSLADLYQHFTGVAGYSDKHGLRGEYFDGSQPRRDKRKIERIDATIDFDFADQGPGDGINAKDFAIRWEGGAEGRRDRRI